MMTMMTRTKKNKGPCPRLRRNLGESWNKVPVLLYRAGRSRKPASRAGMTVLLLQELHARPVRDTGSGLLPQP